MIRATLLAATTAGIFAMPVAAQDSTTTEGAVCIKPAPAPKCSIVVLTNLGVSVVAGNNFGDGSVRLSADWGFLFNVSRRAGVGATLYTWVNRAGPYFAPSVRYRRWSDDGLRSAEIGIGLPFGDSGHPTSPFLMLKWNPTTLIGVVLRPELRTRTVDCSIGTYNGCVTGTFHSFGLAAGAEISGGIGTVGTLVTILGGFIALLASGGGS